MFNVWWWRPGKSRQHDHQTSCVAISEFLFKFPWAGTDPQWLHIKYIMLCSVWSQDQCSWREDWHELWLHSLERHKHCCSLVRAQDWTGVPAKLHVGPEELEGAQPAPAASEDPSLSGFKDSRMSSGGQWMAKHYPSKHAPVSETLHTAITADEFFIDKHTQPEK